jgi:hypothetical protein
MTGRSFAGKPATSAPTAAEVPGEADGLGGAVVLAGADAEAEAEASVDEAVPGDGALHADTASNTVPAASRPRRAGMGVPMTFTGAFLLGLMPDSASSLVSRRA